MIIIHQDFWSLQTATTWHYGIIIMMNTIHGTVFTMGNHGLQKKGLTGLKFPAVPTTLYVILIFTIYLQRIGYTTLPVQMNVHPTLSIPMIMGRHGVSAARLPQTTVLPITKVITNTGVTVSRELILFLQNSILVIILPAFTMDIFRMEKLTTLKVLKRITIFTTEDIYLHLISLQKYLLTIQELKGLP